MLPNDQIPRQLSHPISLLLLHQSPDLALTHRQRLPRLRCGVLVRDELTDARRVAIDTFHLQMAARVVHHLVFDDGDHRT